MAIKMPEYIFNTKVKMYHIIIVIGLVSILCDVLFGFILFTPVLKIAVKMQKALKPGNEMRDFYLKLPVPLDFRVYFFNISNPSEVEEGQIPILEEVGPYCYDAYKEKINIEEDKEKDSLTYSPYETYFFNQTRSGELSQDDYVTILNPLIVGMVNTVADQQPRYLSVLNKALMALFRESNKIYMTTRVRDILFDGIKIDCTIKDFAATAVCSQFKGLPAMIEITKNIYLFSLFGSRNGTIPKRITVLRGIKKGKDIGRVIAVDNVTDMQVWAGKECNEFHGTDGWIFPSFLKKEEGIWSVATDICRSIKAKYVENIKFNGVNVRKYFADFGDMSSNPEEKCFCPTPETCLPKGVMDLTKCLKVPIYCTLPHFLEVSDNITEQVKGLKPDREKHIIKIYFDPVTGTPMLGKRRIQFNLKLRPVNKISIMQTVPEALHPILWLEEGIELEGYLLSKITTVLMLLRMCEGFKYAFLIVSLQVLAYGFYKAYKDWKLSQVGPVQNPENKEEIDLQSSEVSNGNGPVETKSIETNVVKK